MFKRAIIFFSITQLILNQIMISDGLRDDIPQMGFEVERIDILVLRATSDYPWGRSESCHLKSEFASSPSLDFTCDLEPGAGKGAIMEIVSKPFAQTPEGTRMMKEAYALATTTRLDVIKIPDETGDFGTRDRERKVVRDIYIEAVKSQFGGVTEEGREVGLMYVPETRMVHGNEKRFFYPLHFSQKISIASFCNSFHCDSSSSPNIFFRQEGTAAHLSVHFTYSLPIADYKALFDSHANYPKWGFCDRYAAGSYSRFFCAFRLTEAFFASSPKQGSENKNQWEDLPRFSSGQLFIWMREAGLDVVDDAIDANIEAIRREPNYAVREQERSPTRGLGGKAFERTLTRRGDEVEPKYAGFLHPLGTGGGGAMLWVIIETRGSAEAQRKIRARIAVMESRAARSAAAARGTAVSAGTVGSLGLAGLAPLASSTSAAAAAVVTDRAG